MEENKDQIQPPPHTEYSDNIHGLRENQRQILEIEKRYNFLFNVLEHAKEELASLEKDEKVTQERFDEQVQHVMTLQEELDRLWTKKLEKEAIAAEFRKLLDEKK